MLSRRGEFFSGRRAVRWLLPTALLAVTPKCLLCVAGYAGLGVALGLGGPEICGASADTPVAWIPVLAWFGIVGGLGLFGFRVSCGRMRSVLMGKSKHCSSP